MKAAQDVGITSVTKTLSKSTTEEELLKIIDELNNSDDVDGILVQLPLPEHISERKVSCRFTHRDGFTTLLPFLDL